jgi:hypothetical protein
VSPAWTADGQELVVYAESVDRGVTVNCDVFVDGRSATTGEPIGVVSGRAATIDRRAPAYMNRLAQAAEGL